MNTASTISINIVHFVQHNWNKNSSTVSKAGITWNMVA